MGSLKNRLRDVFRRNDVRTITNGYRTIYIIRSKRVRLMRRSIPTHRSSSRSRRTNLQIQFAGYTITILNEHNTVYNAFSIAATRDCTCVCVCIVRRSRVIPSEQEYGNRISQRKLNSPVLKKKKKVSTATFNLILQSTKYISENKVVPNHDDGGGR